VSAPRTPAGYDLVFVFPRVRDAAPLVVAYDAGLFERTTIDRLIASFVTLLGAASRGRDTAVERLPLFTAEELRALTVDRDSGSATYAAEPVHHTFEALAGKQPAATAVTFKGESLTYAELDARSSKLAHHLIELGVGPDVPVGICIRPSLDILVGILGVWKARGIYLPLDPTHPEALVGRMLEEAQPRVVLTHSALAGLTRAFTQLCFDTDWGIVEPRPATSPALASSLEDAAYLLYTSGTTGRPKGVVATQGNLAHYIHVAQQKYGFRASDVFCSLARYTFSISMFDLVSPLCCGGSLRIVERDDILAPERLCQALEEVTVVHAGPSLLGSLSRYIQATPAAPRSFPRMRHASTGGDLVPPAIMEDMKRIFANAEIFVIYGCTEISCMGTTYPVSRDTKATRSFVGKPFPDVVLRVVDPGRQLVPFGVVGEICFAGKGIVRGYLKQPELTTEKFVERGGLRFYQTGDMGRLHEGGDLEILGRSDFQVQLRGIRVELGAIENTIRDLGLAAQCAVVAKKLDVDDVRLVGFVVKPNDASVSSFRRALSAQLPDYMLPQHVVVLEAMPLTANGKLDRNRLQEMAWEPQRATHLRAAPQTQLEHKIAAIFCSVLGLEGVSVDEDFFDLGGDSLHAVIALMEIESSLGLTFSPYALFESATVRALAGQADSTKNRAPSRPILLNEKCDAPPLFMLSGIHIYRELAKRLEGHCPAYGVFATSEFGALESATVRYTVPALAREYVEIIRGKQARGPYRILGYSFAGIVAYEVAQQLLAAGEEVRYLAIIDAALPEWTQGWRYRVAQLRRATSVPPRALASYVSRRLREGRMPPRSEFARYQDDAKVGPLEQQRDDVNNHAATEYMATLKPFAGDVTMIASGVRLRNDPLKSPSGGWRPHIASLRIESIDADHFKMLSDDPYVSQLAEILVRHMR
jgi:amino acid adenylation domain-containing protein